METTWVSGEDTTPMVRQASAGYVVLCNRPGPDRTDAGEDYTALVDAGEAGLLLALADGMGGAAHGHLASETAIHTLCNEVDRRGELDRESILDGIEQANARVLELGGGAATTLTAVVIREGTMRAYQVGDSSALLIGLRGQVKFETITQGPTGYAIQSGLLNPEDAMHHEDRHVVSNMLGAENLHIDIGPALPIRPRDTVVLGSDGIFDNLLTSEVVELVRKGPAIAAVERVLAIAWRRMTDPKVDEPSKPDDASLVLYRPRGPSPKRGGFNSTRRKASL